jgi:hypothetical protein
VARPVPGVKKGINSLSGMGAQERDCLRLPESNDAMTALPGALCQGRSSVMARPCPALHCRMRSAWRGTGEPRLVGLCSAAGLLGTLAYLALACFSALWRYASPWGICYCWVLGRW